MTTITHAPLVSRTPSLPLLDSPVKLRPTTKRARSPVPTDQGQAQEHAIKRHKSSATTNVPTAPANEKERRKAEKLERETVWRAKYLEHFPRWIFFFDPDGFDQEPTATRKKIIRGVQSLGAVGTGYFYQRRSTHLFSVGGRFTDRRSHSSHHRRGSKFRWSRFSIKQREQPKFTHNRPTFTEKSCEIPGWVSCHLMP